MHGGKSLKGLASPNYKTGRWSKYAPSRLLAKYDEARSDSELLSMREEIALLDARLSDLLQRVDTGEAGSLWKQAKAIFLEFTAWREQGNTDEMAKSLEKLKDVITQGNADYAAWGEIESILQQRRLMSESEQKRLIAMQSMVSAERATIFVFKILDILKRNIQDRKILSNINAELSLLLVEDNDQIKSKATYFEAEEPVPPLPTRV